MAWKTLDQLELSGKTALVRVDLNVPVDAGRVTDATRIERIVPTVRDILAAGGKPVLLAHFGRPKGERVAEMSLSQIVGACEAAMGVPVRFAEDCVGDAANDDGDPDDQRYLDHAFGWHQLKKNRIVKKNFI